jgi:hypothetical protein
MKERRPQMAGRIRKAAVGLLSVGALVLGTSSMLGDRAFAAPATPLHRLGAAGITVRFMCGAAGSERGTENPRSHLW